ncbi:nitroreductase family protein [Cytobacillus horneckiae]|uniref:Nitroreductase family protein n=1 Tax=Cytobacillus horneckiae TaxID=549687 RepID=A0A2N0ZA27_9BACI|nr:nitroreductase family protein [Cytobacillus horneckiae]MCM3178783.1 nitroreductase family protein [Cytobacillus horneckiae]MEC1158802.1 nitroreductase family protein [Cytobacillus horneckiae]MED2937325.1 nitroreductase family protein [Cytobacillus horneckiae]PKG26362.1 nitroreductase family protein [Cytobacillus horneckiae]
MDLKELIKNRRSANNFIEGIPITQNDLNPIFEDVKFAPSAFNLQHTEYIAVLDKDLKDKVYEAAYKQYKVKSASAVILVTADRLAYKQTERIHQGMLSLGMLTEFELTEMIEDNTHFYEGRGEAFQKEDAIRNASLSAMLFMLAAKNHGWDTCPMIGFDQEKIRNLLDIPSTHEIVLMITIGHEKMSNRRLRGYRKPVDEFVKIY